MKNLFLKFILLFTYCLLLSTLLYGCATYKFQHGQAPYNKGYVVSRDDYTILEYTLGEDKTVPLLELARERFKRRRNIVEHYYKKMGYIKNHFTMVIWDPCMSFLKITGALFRLPWIAISEYRYEKDPAYREKIRKIEAEKDQYAEAGIQDLKNELNTHIQQDLVKEKYFKSK